METNRKFCDVDAEPMTSGDKVPTIYGPLWEGSGMSLHSRILLAVKAAAQEGYLERKA